MVSLAAATPVQDAKAALGGVIDAAQAKTIGGTPYLLVTHRRFAGGDQTVTLLKRFAGRYTPVWFTPRDVGGLGFPLLGAELTDLNKDGAPEVFYAYVNEGNEYGRELYQIVDLAKSVAYTAEIDYAQDGSPGTIFVGKSLNAPAVKAFLAFMEQKIARSDRLKDTRNPITRVSDTWMERYGAFLEQDALDPPLRITPVSAPLNSDVCRIDGSVDAKLTVGTTEYRSYFGLGLMAFDKAAGVCQLIMVGLDHDGPDTLQRINQEIHVPFRVSGRTAVYNPASRTLRWLKATP